MRRSGVKPRGLTVRREIAVRNLWIFCATSTSTYPRMLRIWVASQRLEKRYYQEETMGLVF